MSEKPTVVLDVEMYSISDLKRILGIKTGTGVSKWTERYKVKGTWLTVKDEKGRERHKKYFARKQIIAVLTGEKK